MRIWWPILILLLAQGGALGDGSRVTARVSALGRNLLVVALTEASSPAASLSSDQQADAKAPVAPNPAPIPSVILPAPDEFLVGSVVPRAGPLA